MANDKLKNLMPIEEVNSRRTREQHSADSRKAGIASGEARRKKKAMREMLETCLEMENDKGMTYRQLATMGLIKGAIKGNAQNYRTILETLGELKEAQENKKQQELSKVEELLLKIEEEANK